MKYLRLSLILIFCFLSSNSLLGQTGLSNAISAFPSYDAVVTQFYTNYAPEAGQDPNLIINFARKPTGWYIITFPANDPKSQTSTPFWLPSAGYLSLTPHFSVNQKSEKAFFPQHQSEESARTRFNMRMFNLHTFYGYHGWADDIVDKLKPIESQLSDADLYSLGRAHSARASTFVHHNINGSLLPMFVFNPAGNSLTEQELTIYQKENAAARACFDTISARNPLFNDIVGKIQTKYANEVMQAYLDLLIFQNETLAKQQLLPNIYPIEILSHARNYLNSLPKNALFISFGDNDTYPLWYVQIMENCRNDVLVINYTLLGLTQYISALRRGLNGNAVHFSINQSTYDSVEFMQFKDIKENLNAKSFITWMNNSSNIEIQINNFPGLELDCIALPKDKNYFYKMEIALIDLYISNANRPFCGASNQEPLTIFGENWDQLGLVYELDPCNKKQPNSDELVDYFNSLDCESYSNKINFPYKPGTTEYIDDIVILKLYQHLFQTMVTCKEAGEAEQLTKLQLIWNKWTSTWAVKPEPYMLNYYKEYFEEAVLEKKAKKKRYRPTQ